MKKSIVRILTGVLMAAPVMANALDLQKVYDVLQAPFVGGPKQDLLKLENGRIVASYARKFGGLTLAEEMQVSPPRFSIENCRQLGIRQALLDTAATGGVFQEFSRKSSHRIGYVPGRPDAVKLYVAVKLIEGGVEMERTYVYMAEDPSGGDCRLTETLPVIPGMMKKSAAEAMMIEELMKLSPEEQAAALAKEQVSTPKDWADKQVKKIFSTECDQHTINHTLVASQNEFYTRFQKNPVIFMDFEQSLITGNVAFEPDNHDAGFKGDWIVRMVDADGVNQLKTKVHVEVADSPDGETCVASGTGIGALEVL